MEVRRFSTEQRSFPFYGLSPRKVSVRSARRNVLRFGVEDTRTGLPDRLGVTGDRPRRKTDVVAPRRRHYVGVGGWEERAADGVRRSWGGLRRTRAGSRSTACSRPGRWSA